MEILIPINSIDITTYCINPKITRIMGSPKNGRERNYRIDFVKAGGYYYAYEYPLGRAFKSPVDYEFVDFFYDEMLKNSPHGDYLTYDEDIIPEWIKAIIDVARGTKLSAFVADNGIKTKMYRINPEFLLERFKERYVPSKKVFNKCFYVDIVEYPSQFDVYLYDVTTCYKNNMITLPKTIHHKMLTCHDALKIAVNNLRYTDFLEKYFCNEES